MANFSGKITLNGWGNLGTLMKAAGFPGGGIVSSLGIFNPHASNICYIHLSQDGGSHPATGTDGWPIGASTSEAGNTFFSDRGANVGSLDVGTTWLFTSGSIDLKVIAAGA